ncbi:MAG: SDR family oxidoreductase [Sneathiella sp.]|nr:SDR family oxidoreductase [Sneathiella sp.]
MEFSTVIITGANRGIGLALTRRFFQSGQWRILACCRDPDSARELQEMANRSGDKIGVYRLDVSQQDSVEAFAKTIDGQRVDVLLNNAGIKGGNHQTLLDMDYDAWAGAFAVNSMAPLRMVQAVLKNLRLSPAPKIATITSQMGAMTWPGRGSYAYSSSKAAVNKVMRILALDLEPEGIIVSLFHPGWVQTDMGGKSATISPEESAEGLFTAITNLKKSDSGRFFKWTGEEHAW